MLAATRQQINWLNRYFFALPATAVSDFGSTTIGV
jgi:hypothetical protein